MRGDIRSPEEDRRGWWLASLGLLGLVLAAVVVLELWESLPGLLRGPRGLVVDGLHWLREHWLTSGALGVLATLVGFWLQRRERQRTERHKAAEQARQEAAAQAERARQDAEARAAW
jgi:hypothetical protein